MVSFSVDTENVPRKIELWFGAFIYAKCKFNVTDHLREKFKSVDNIGMFYSTYVKSSSYPAVVV